MQNKLDLDWIFVSYFFDEIDMNLYIEWKFLGELESFS